MSDYGDATITRCDDGRLVVERADPVIGIAVELLARADFNLPVDDDGCIWLAGDPRYRYRPVRFAPATPFKHGPLGVVVCERVEASAPGGVQ